MNNRVASLLSLLFEEVSTNQKESIINLKSWFVKLGESINQVSKSSDGLLIYKIDSIKPELSNLHIFIYPNGVIKISGRQIGTFKELENMITYLLG